MKKAFTIAELMVAVAIMAITLAATGWVFKISMDAHRTATATAEIMRNFRAITDQLDSDFAGWRRDAGILISSQLANDWRSDGFAIFSVGNFRTIRQYDINDTDARTIFGKDALISYSFSSKPDPTGYDRSKLLLLRQQMIFTSEPNVPDPCTALNSYTKEYARGSVADWKATNLNASMTSAQVEALVAKVITRPAIDYNNIKVENIPLVLANGAGQFAVQLDDGFDPNGSGKTIWWPENTDFTGGATSNNVEAKVNKAFSAVKFTFTLYSKTKVNGKPLNKTFTHIIDLSQEN